MQKIACASAAINIVMIMRLGGLFCIKTRTVRSRSVNMGRNLLPPAWSAGRPPAYAT